MPECSSPDLSPATRRAIGAPTGRPRGELRAAARTLQLHRLDRKTEISCVRCGNRSQTRVVATVGGDWTRLIDRGCYDTWVRQLGTSESEGPA